MPPAQYRLLPSFALLQDSRSIQGRCFKHDDIIRRRGPFVVETVLAQLTNGRLFQSAYLAENIRVGAAHHGERTMEYGDNARHGFENARLASFRRKGVVGHGYAYFNVDRFVDISSAKLKNRDRFALMADVRVGKPGIETLDGFPPGVDIGDGPADVDGDDGDCFQLAALGRGEGKYLGVNPVFVFPGPESKNESGVGQTDHQIKHNDFRRRKSCGKRSREIGAGALSW
jgi:hypothetical protein